MKIFQVDAFTDKPFQGNPAGVCLLEQPQPDVWMQNIAGEKKTRLPELRIAT